MGTSGTRCHDPDAGLWRVLLVLRDRTDFSRRTRSRHRQVRPDAGLYRTELHHAAGARSPAAARRRWTDPPSHTRAPDHWLLGHVSRRYRLGVVKGNRDLLPWRPFGRHLPDVLRLAHRRRSPTTAKRSGPAGLAKRVGQRIDSGHALFRHAGVVSGARVPRNECTGEPG